MTLDCLHDIREEPFALRDEAVLPHLIGDETDKVGGEQDLLDGGGIGKTRGWYLQSPHKAVQDILVQPLDVLV